MRTARSLTASRGICIGGSAFSRVCPTPWKQTPQSCDQWCVLGSQPPPSVDRQKPVKTLPCQKLRLRLVKITLVILATSIEVMSRFSKMNCFANFSYHSFFQFYVKSHSMTEISPTYPAFYYNTTWLSLPCSSVTLELALFEVCLSSLISRSRRSIFLLSDFRSSSNWAMISWHVSTSCLEWNMRRIVLVILSHA